MLKITRAANGEVVFTVSGRQDAENLAELKTLFSSEAIPQNGWLIGCGLGVGDSPVLLGSRDVEDQGTTDLRACRIGILKTHEEMCQGVLFFLGTAIAVSNKCCTYLVK
jgi:hypothetical protein